MKIAFFGSSLVSAYWNGAATYYRGMLRALHRRGHAITFFEPDAYDRQMHRDIEDPEYARVRVYPATEAGLDTALEEAASADLVVKASGVGVFDALLESRVLELRSDSARVAFWDVDAPATLTRMREDPADPFRACVPEYDIVLTYGGGPPVIEEYELFGARRCVPIYNAHDPDVHHPVPPEPRFQADLAFMANRLPDREERVHAFFVNAARRLPRKRFLLGGNGWDPAELPGNIHCIGHTYTRDHNAFNSSPLAVLNINRASMAAYGWSPATRVFEAAAAGACIITDKWEGVDHFLKPCREWLVARNGLMLADLVSSLTEDRAREIGRAARARVLRDHTYTQRAAQVEAALALEPVA